MFSRIVNPSKTNSFFLFGARGTGKSTYLSANFSDEDTLFIDLLNLEKEALLLRHPNFLIEQIRAKGPDLKRVVIDEIQKLPKLLDVVHQQIEETKRAKRPLQFVLTGSSARKLKRGAANLLAGRAFLYELFPLTHRELGNPFDLKDVLQYGSLPGIYSYDNASDKRAYLETYGRTYLKEEIWNEQIVRKLEPFAHFLEVAAQCNGKILNYSKIGRDIGTDAKTVQSYYQILEDTLVGVILQPYHRSVRKRETKAPKFYLFDTGVKRALEGTLTVELLPQTYAFGEAFEHFIILELMRLNSYYQLGFRLYYFRTHEDAEVDLVMERPGKSPILIEIKSADFVDAGELRSLERIAHDFGDCECVCLCRGTEERKVKNVLILPWKEGLERLCL
ncbi:MAG: ATP-binding protein [Deltaproteobacteria bacterium]|nr:ATP-binding protein [Deltaproteobacteria bacterium]